MALPSPLRRTTALKTVEVTAIKAKLQLGVDSEAVADEQGNKSPSRSSPFRATPGAAGRPPSAEAVVAKKVAVSEMTSVPATINTAIKVPSNKVESDSDAEEAYV